MSVVHSDEAILLVQEEHTGGTQAGHLMVASKSHIYSKHLENIWNLHARCALSTDIPL